MGEEGGERQRDRGKNAMREESVTDGNGNREGKREGKECEREKGRNKL